MSFSTLTEFIRLVFVARNLANFLRFFGRKILVPRPLIGQLRELSCCVSRDQNIYSREISLQVGNYMLLIKNFPMLHSKLYLLAEKLISEIQFMKFQPFERIIRPSFSLFQGPINKLSRVHLILLIPFAMMHRYS